MDEQSVTEWIERYVQAWNSSDPGQIGSLFNENARYYTGPFDEPWRGREAITAGWLSRKDSPGSFRFRYQVLAASGATGIVRGWTLYLDPPREFSNLWVIQFDDKGLCTEFTEWWVQRG